MSATEQTDARPDAGIGAAPATPFVTQPRLTRQLPVAIVAPVRSRQLAPLRSLLERIGEDAAGNAELPLGRLLVRNRSMMPPVMSIATTTAAP